jgi:hypothetical protein
MWHCFGHSPALCADFQNPKEYFILRIPARRYPAGVDKRFDDFKSDTSELIRLARRGHVFSAAEAEMSGAPNENPFRSVWAGLIMRKRP